MTLTPMSPDPAISLESSLITDNSGGHFSIVDTGNPAEIELYEKAFYNVFVEVTTNKLVRKIWDWDEESRRLRTKIHYKDQVIFTWKNREGDIKCAVAVNLNNAESQFGNYGFTVPAEKKGRHVEVLTLFAQNLDRANGFRLDQFFFRPHCVTFMQKAGYDFALSTCAERPLATYLRWGWEVLDEAVIDNQKRYFLFYDIHKNLPRL